MKKRMAKRYGAVFLPGAMSARIGTAPIAMKVAYGLKTIGSMRK